MSSYTNVKGVLPVILTPWDENFDIHEDDFAKQVDYCYEVGADGIVIGQVSELMRMNSRERENITDMAVKYGKPKGHVVVSSGGESTKNAIEYSLYAQESGVDAVLLMHPSTSPLTEQRMHKYYRDVIEQLHIPVMIHHAKSYAKTPMTIKMQADLLHEFGADRILFKPESSPLPPKHTELQLATDNQARIFEGDGGMMIIDSYFRGLYGSIPATDCVKYVVKIWSYLQAGDIKSAEKLAYPLSYMMCQMMNSIDCYQHLSKHILYRKGLISHPRVREPVDHVPDVVTYKEIDRIISVLDNICQ
ncbi:dihydrodipicolinate synthase family protein [Pantoea agglomerans]|uniref:dihydrodipicolinate synthase family protein n=1 Tax=Enterobacter agglomerans TaxID=549 RepID=UPI0017815E2B|nr:dihydrodipicolinate synthase family protein [Pantoea agglomerans]MBD8158034.1 dihydrodipicolinate synthase family protein [Pantoea agglomerans]MBD8233094.1 dihydrodipicolinate synthase family protein [Pantoea agglomerans]WAB86745.1 dihydrodipicolinate synthase family protein [Pantoea agglomerans]